MAGEQIPDDGDPRFAYASCPRCGGGEVVRARTPEQRRRADDGGWLKVHKNVVVCRGCGEVVYEKEHAVREEAALAATATEKKDDEGPRDRFALLDVDD